MTRKNIIILVVCVLIAVLCGLATHDLVIGGGVLATGLLCAYFASEGKRLNYIFGLINYLLMGYVALENNLFGVFGFYVFVFAPLQLKGFFSWKEKLDASKSVEVRHFGVKDSVIVVVACVVGSVLLGYLLTLIPGQQLALLDATSNCINLCGVILMILRFEESWWLWLINNVVDLVIWVVIVARGGQGSVMMLLVSVGYLLINIYGIVKWRRKAMSM